MKKILKSIIIAIAAIVSVTAMSATVLFPSGGGTGTSTPPSAGQLLMGNVGGTYSLVSTSSLGISGGPQLATNGSLNGDQTRLNLTAVNGMTITDDGFGNIGFSSNPVLTLQDVTVNGYITADPIQALQFITSGGSSSDFVKGDGSLDFNTYVTTANQLWTRSSTTTYLTNSSDFVGIGTTTPVTALHVAGTATSDIFNLSGAITTVPSMGMYSPGSGELAFSFGGVRAFRLVRSTNVMEMSTVVQLRNNVGSVGTPSISFVGGTNTGIWSPSTSVIALSNGGSETVRVTAAGNVGINTTAPQQLLEVSTTTGYIMAIRSNSLVTGDKALIRFINSSTAANVYSSYIGSERGTSGMGALVFGTNGAGGTGDSTAERMRISPSGNVGIGTSNPLSPLSIASSTTAVNLFSIDRFGHHVTGNGGSASTTVALCGTATLSGNDTAGTVTISGGAPSACTIVFAGPRTGSSYSVNALAATNITSYQPVATKTSTSTLIQFSGTVTQFDYQILDR